MPADLDNFLDPVPPPLICPVCQEAAWPPVIACENQHVLCDDCIESMLEADDVPALCPTCRAPLKEDFVECTLGKRIFEGLRFQCSCEYREVVCYTCREKSLAKDGVKHTTICPSALVAWPNGDNDVCGKIRQGNLEQHMAVCTRFRCRNFAFCGAQSTRANLEEHQPRCTSLISRLDAVEKEASSLRAQLASRPPRLPSPPRPPKPQPQDKPLITSLDPPGMSRTHLLLIRLDEGSFVADLDKETVKKVSAPVGPGRPLRSRSPPPQRQGGDDRWAVPVQRGGQGGGGGGGGKRSRFDSPPRRGRTWGRGG
ncbi:E3 ubiquitin-protein ligase siah2 [Rhodotorula toruloides]